jgi:hypothetical protein
VALPKELEETSDFFRDLHGERIADEARAVVFEQRPVQARLEDGAVVDDGRGHDLGLRIHGLGHVDRRPRVGDLVETFAAGQD